MDDSVEKSDVSDDEARFAANMQVIRERQGLSQADLVRVLRDAGWPNVHQTTVSRIEKRERPVKLGEARAIARALNVELNQMLLTPGSARFALDLATRRAGLDRARTAIREGARAFYEQKRDLDNLIAEVRAEGYEPTQFPTGEAWVFRTSDGSVEDELALAIQTAGADPVNAVNTGRVLAGMRTDSGGSDGLDTTS